MYALSASSQTAKVNKTSLRVRQSIVGMAIACLILTLLPQLDVHDHDAFGADSSARAALLEHLAEEHHGEDQTHAHVHESGLSAVVALISGCSFELVGVFPARLDAPPAPGAMHGSILPHSLHRPPAR